MSYRGMVIDGGLHTDAGCTIEEAAAWLEQGDREEAEKRHHRWSQMQCVCPEITEMCAKCRIADEEKP